MRTLIKRIFFSWYQPIVAKRIYRHSIYKWNDIQLYLPPGVFHPRYFYSTRFLLDEVLTNPLRDKKVLELGAGNGLISIACAKKGAHVVSSDISKRAVDALVKNAAANQVNLEIIHSDLFSSIPQQHFDLIAINPPYYPKTPRNEFELAWYCGEHYEYFEQLFLQLPRYIDSACLVLMVLSEDCNLEHIFSIAKKNNLTFRQIAVKRFFREHNMIYSITKQ